MASNSRKRHVMSCLIFGTMTAALYAAVFSFQDVVMHYFTKGGAYALLPVSVVFAFSYAHGNFTSSFWSALGIEKSKSVGSVKKEVGYEISETKRPRKETRPRARVSV